MKGLRRHAPAFAFLFAWAFALGTLLGGLALARTLPEAHAEALSHGALCLPGEDGAPVHRPDKHGIGCVLCPAPSGAAHQAGLPPIAVGVAAIFGATESAFFTFAFTSALDDPFRQVGWARAPPRV